MTLKQVRREVESQGFAFVTSLEFLPLQHIIIFDKPVDKEEKTPATPATEGTGASAEQPR